MPALIGRRKVDDFRRAFGGPLDSLAAVYRRGMADAMEVLSNAASTLAQRRYALSHLRQYNVVLSNLRDETAAWAQLHMPASYRLGMEFADDGIRSVRRAGINLGKPQYEVFSQVHRQAAESATTELLRTTDFAIAQIGRRVDDVFRRVGMEEVTKGIVEGATRLDVSKAIKERLIDEGRPFFLDRAGRKWDLDRYSEMVARTTTREAATTGTINRLSEHNIWLAQVSAHNAGDFCLYYENVIVFIGDDPNPTPYPPISAIEGGPPFHPQCLIRGSRVLTSSGWRAIECIRRGDLVMTHRGRWRRVTAMMQREYEGELVQLGALRVTPEHPVLTQHGWVTAGSLSGAEKVAILQASDDRIGGQFGPLAVANPNDLIAQGANSGIAGFTLGNAFRLAPVVDLDGHIAAVAREEEVCDVAPDGMLERIFDAGCGERGTDRGFVGMRFAAIGASSRDRHFARESFVAAGVTGPAHATPIASERGTVRVSDAVSLRPAPGAGLDAVAGEPDTQQLCGIAADLYSQLLQRGAFGISAAKKLLQRFAHCLSEALFSDAAPKLLPATEGASRAAQNPVAAGDAQSEGLVTNRTASHRDPIIPLPRRACNYSGVVYNLSVAEDESYIAERIVVHNCVHVLTPFVERLATEAEKQAGKIDADLLNKSPAELQRRFRAEFPERARAEGKRLREQAARGRGAIMRRAERRALAGPPPMKVPALREMPVGTVLRRTYKGREYVAEVLHDGRIMCNGQVYRSLTELAKNITGQTAISGPRFFGVAERGKRGVAIAPTPTRAAPGEVAAPRPPRLPPRDELQMARYIADDLATLMDTKVGWNGKLTIEKIPDAVGLKQWNCSIVLDQATRERLTELMQLNAESWAHKYEWHRRQIADAFQTLVHEMTHAAGPQGSCTQFDFVTAAQRWIEEAVTSAASERMAPVLFKQIMGFEAGLAPEAFGPASYASYQQALAKALGGPQYGRTLKEPMRGIATDLQLDLAYKTPRKDRLFRVATEMSKAVKGQMTAVEIEAALEAGADQAVRATYASARAAGARARAAGKAAGARAPAITRAPAAARALEIGVEPGAARAAPRGAAIIEKPIKAKVGAVRITASAGIRTEGWDGVVAIARGIPSGHMKGVKGIDLLAEVGPLARAGKASGNVVGTWYMQRITMYDLGTRGVAKKTGAHFAHEVGHNLAMRAELKGLLGRDKVARAWNELHDIWKKEDGVSPYARAWWKRGKGKVSETIAEMYRLRMTQPAAYRRLPEALRKPFEVIYNGLA